MKKENYLEAFTYISKIDETYTQSKYKYFIFKGLVLLNLGKYHYSIKMLDKAEYILMKNEINDNSKNYLLNYIYDLKYVIYLAFEKDIEILHYRKKRNELKYDLSKVTENLKRLFPIPKSIISPLC